MRAGKFRNQIQTVGGEVWNLRTLGTLFTDAKRGALDMEWTCGSSPKNAAAVFSKIVAAVFGF